MIKNIISGLLVVSMFLSNAITIEENTIKGEKILVYNDDVKNLPPTDAVSKIEVQKIEPKREEPEPNKSVIVASRGGELPETIIDMEVTGYCDYGTTASGAITKPWHTVATDWRVIPKGTEFWIEGFGMDKIFVAEDTGGAVKGHILDIYNPSYDWCINWGRRKIKIHVIRWGNNEKS